MFHQGNPAQGRRIAEKVIASFPYCPIAEIARRGRTLKQWREPFLAYFTTAGANNGGTEAMNGLIELHRRVARGFRRDRENYRLRMLLIAGGLTDPRIPGASTARTKSHCPSLTPQRCRLTRTKRRSSDS